MSQQDQAGGRKTPAPDEGSSQRKPNLSQGADAMSQSPGAREDRQRKPNLDQGADAMSRRPEADEDEPDSDR